MENNLNILPCTYTYLILKYQILRNQLQYGTDLFEKFRFQVNKEVRSLKK